MSTTKPIIPVESLTASNIADFFDERTIINDDLNMAGYFIYNFKDPEDDQDAVTKIYVDTKTYAINSGNITGNLPWSRIDNIPSFFPSKISLLTVDQGLDLGSNAISTTKVPTSDNHVVNKLYLTNYQLVSANIPNSLITDAKIYDVQWSKITNKPTAFPSSTSVLTLDSNLDFTSTTYKITGLPTPSANSDAATKKYVDDTVAANGTNNADVTTLKSYFTNGLLNLANFNKPSTANYVLTYDGANII